MSTQLLAPDWSIFVAEFTIQQQTGITSNGTFIDAIIATSPGLHSNGPIWVSILSIMSQLNKIQFIKFTFDNNPSAPPHGEAFNPSANAEVGRLDIRRDCF